MTTTIADPAHLVPAPRPGWATEHETRLGLTTWRRPARTVVTAFPDGTDEAPYPVTVVLDEHHADGIVEGPLVNVYVQPAGVALAFTIEQARQFRAALGELIAAHDIGAIPGQVTR